MNSTTNQTHRAILSDAVAWYLENNTDIGAPAWVFAAQTVSIPASAGYRLLRHNQLTIQLTPDLADAIIAYSTDKEISSEQATIQMVESFLIKIPARFQETFCSQCGDSFGPGDHGFSHCEDHKFWPDESGEARK